MKNYYKILGVAKNASRLDIRKAYLQKAKLYHPDLNPSPSAANNFKDVQEAYNTLYDVNKRREYDALGSRFNRTTYTTGYNQHRNYNNDTQFNSSTFEEQFRAEAEQLRRQWQEMEANKYRKDNADINVWNILFNTNTFPFYTLRYIFYFINRILPLIIFPLSLMLMFSRDLMGNHTRIRNKVQVTYDSYGRAYMFDSYGRRYRVPQFDRQ